MAIGGGATLYFATRSGGAAAHNEPDIPPPIVSPVGFPPIAYFQERCEHCHGQFGMVWSEGFSHPYGAMELLQKVDAMCSGPGTEPLAGAKLDAVFSYVRSIGAGELFLTFTSREGDTIRGEVSPGCQVTLIAGGRRIPADVVEFQWSAPLAATVGPAEVIATLDGRSARIDLTTHNSTQSTPAAYPHARR